MSGPIIRKYGFANFEKIFGERELQHGLSTETPPAEKPGETPPPKEAAARPDDSATKKP